MLNRYIVCFGAFVLFFGNRLLASQPIDIGSDRQLFVDEFLIERFAGTTLKLHEPVSAGKALVYDGPSDNVYSFYTSVIKDGDLYRMYYRCGRPGMDWGQQYTCYAESRDGVSWTRPILSLIAIDGSNRNNAILDSGENFSAFLDEKPGVPASERLKACAMVDQRLKGYVSGDGIHWRLIQNEPIVPYEFPNNFDSQNSIFWSAAEQQYVLYARHQASGVRSMTRATSLDFIHWSPQVPMNYSDTGTIVPSQHLYTNQTQPYFRAKQIYIAMPGRFQEGRRVLTDEQAASIVIAPFGGVSDISDGVFLSTRPGSLSYDFRFRESFVRPGIGIKNWTSRNNYPALGVVPTSPQEMSIYVQRNYEQPTAYLERMVLRTDGFVSVNAPYNGGRFDTKPLRFDGSRLEINYATSAAGGLRVELQDAEGNPLPGFSLADCDLIVGDEIDRIISWHGRSDLNSLRGRVLRLRIEMRDADLYSFRFF